MHNQDNKNLILTAHQPVYLPWLGLLHKIALADKFVVFDTVQYLKKDWNNRNKIKTAQGPIWLTVPTLTHGKFDQILTDVLIDNKNNWQKKHLKSIELNYRKAPYFNQYIDFFRNIYAQEWKYLVDLNNEILRFMLKEFKINVEILNGHDLDLVGHKSELVLDMCNKLAADSYIFGSLGKDYADVDEFKRSGVKVIFQEYNHPKYPQQFKGFDANLSAIDLLFNCGEKSYEIMMNKNLIKDVVKKGDL